MSFSTSRSTGFLRHCGIWVLAGLAWGVTAAAGSNPLEEYVAAQDTTFTWKSTEPLKVEQAKGVHLELISQTWRGQFWSHHLLVVRPDEVRNLDMAFLLITGDGDGKRYLDILNTLAQRAGAVAAVITKIPNQPLYNGRKEDALIAFTFDQYLRSGDKTWPLLFPMVKSAVRGMDAVQQFAEKEWGQSIKRFVVSGASKRGWTTWLTGAVDRRVVGIAPMVIDMLNMKAQTDWAKKMYGKQSEEISDYTELNLVERMDEPAMKELRDWVDPYAYRDRYTMPKLLLLGTNDPYWVVDSLRHYWADLPEPKWVFQTPNAGHDLAGGKEAVQTLAAWFQMLTDGQEIPRMDWRIQETARGAKLEIRVSGKTESIRLWTAESADRDFRDEKWSSRPLKAESGSSIAVAEIEKPAGGFRAFLGEVTLKAPTGDAYRLSTEARVVPDGAP